MPNNFCHDTIQRILPLPRRAGARQRLLRLQRRRHRVPRPLRRTRRHLDRPRPARLREGDLGAGRPAGILLQFGRKLASDRAGRKTWPRIGLRRLQPFPLQFGRRGQRKRTQAGVVPDGPRQSAGLLQSLPRPHVGRRRRDGQPLHPFAVQRDAQRGIHPAERPRSGPRQARDARIRRRHHRGHSGRFGHPLPHGRIPARPARSRYRNGHPARAGRNPVGLRPHGTLLRPPVGRHPSRPDHHGQGHGQRLPDRRRADRAPLRGAPRTARHHLRRQPPRLRCGHRRAGCHGAREAGRERRRHGRISARRTA